MKYHRVLLVVPTSAFKGDTSDFLKTEIHIMLTAQKNVSILWFLCLNKQLAPVLTDPYQFYKGTLLKF